MASILDLYALLKSSKLFVTNLLKIFILGILIYHIQLCESSKLLVLERLMHYSKQHCSWFGVENIFGAKLAAILDSEPLGNQETIFE